MQDRNKMIVDDYINNRDMHDICREYGLQERRVYQILRERGVKGIKRKRRDMKKPLSQVHQNIGSRLYEHYFDRGLLRQQAADKLGTNAATLRNMEVGRHNLTLFDLQDISSFLGTSVGELIDGS